MLCIAAQPIANRFLLCKAANGLFFIAVDGLCASNSSCPPSYSQGRSSPAARPSEGDAPGSSCRHDCRNSPQSACTEDPGAWARDSHAAFTRGAHSHRRCAHLRRSAGISAHTRLLDGPGRPPCPLIRICSRSPVAPVEPGALGTLAAQGQRQEEWPNVRRASAPLLATLILQPKGKLFPRRAATQQVATESGCLRRIPALKAGSRIFRVGRQVKRIPMNSSVIDAIGNTPLIRLRKASEATGCEILGKAEFMNP